MAASQVEPGSLRERQEPRSVLLVKPSFFQVVDEKNPYMTGPVDQGAAMDEWNALLGIYRGLAEEGILDRVTVVQGVEDLEDMVFCANQSLPWQDADGNRHVMLSNMRHPSRQREVPHFADFYTGRNYELHHMPDSIMMEGMGDSIFHPFKALLWMGYGYRTSPDAAPILEKSLGMPVMPLHLVSAYFYHLDTCFLPVDDRMVLLCQDAFDDASNERIASVFDDVIHVPREQAVETFCLNTHCIYDRDSPVAVTPAGDHSVKAELKASGYRVIEADTSEFIKSGGSVYCMKMMYFD